MSKLRFFTGIQTTGKLTLGNYCGVIRHILHIQNKYEVIIMIADLHALTVPKKEFNYREKCYEIAALLYACGLKKENCKIFIQSEIKEHLELSFFLSPHISVSALSNMIQYKEKKKEKETGNLALLSYPVLMAADIFLYNVDLVIVGQDQQQHLELTRDIAKKFNNFYEKELLKVPKFNIPTFGSKIMDLQNPKKKMSKSEQNCIFLLDNPETIKKKIEIAITDSENKIYYEPEKKPSVSNLLTIYALFSNKEISKVERELIGLNYHQFKLKIIDLLNDKLGIIQRRYNNFLTDIRKDLEKNNNYLQSLAKEKIKAIKKELKYIL
ncbi:MAG: tryptophanyl-tRNA synthetase [Mycoplasmataceae bacterium RC_NB112A]|nr:MAG: tryptophanyl-tRNA synthetase [Mycoplasmataceae bacterium RC_NB112A]